LSASFDHNRLGVTLVSLEVAITSAAVLKAYTPASLPASFAYNQQ